MNLTTLAAVRAFLAIDAADTSQDALLTSLIVSASDACERYMDRFTEECGRIEEYEVGRGQEIVLLRAFPVVSVLSMKYASDTNDWGAVTALTDSEFRVDLKLGLARIKRSTGYDPGYLRAHYVGGMGASVADFATEYPELSQSVARQVAYEFRRRDIPAGDVSIQGGTTTFQGQMTLLHDVQRVWDAHRRFTW